MMPFYLYTHVNYDSAG